MNTLPKIEPAAHGVGAPTNKQVRGRAKDQTDPPPTWLGSKRSGKYPSFDVTQKNGQKTSEKTVTIISHGSKPKLDKVAVTYHAKTKEERDYIVNMICCSRNDFAAYTIPSRHYRHAYSFDVAGGRICIQADPYSPNVNFLRLEWNPARFADDQHAALKSDLFSLLFPHGHSSSLFRVTRLDVAVDFQFLSPENILIYAPGYKTSINYLNAGGGIQSHYLGSQESPLQIVIYDKAQESTKAKQECAPPPCTRIEFRYRPREAISLADLEGFDPFQNVKVFFAPPPPNVKPHNYAFFLAYGREYGLTAALRRLPKQERAIYRKRLEESAADFWQPERLRGEMGVLIQGLTSYLDECH